MLLKKRIREKQARGEELTQEEKTVPMHDVVLEVMGGASAGGMTAAIASIALFQGITPVNKDNPAGDNNKLFDAWVNLNDVQGGQSTLEQMCTTDDIKNNKVPSLLNSTAIDAIADRAVDIEVSRTLQSENWPAYISRNLEIILTICSLRGIPIEINFGSAYQLRSIERADPVPAHKMHLHKGIAQFTFSHEHAEGRDHLLAVDPYKEVDKQVFIECAKATGAFPIGLRSRLLQGIPHSYLKAHVKRMFANEEININWLKIPDNFDFTAIDGGTINNEPFGEVFKVLEERFEEDSKHLALNPEDAAPNYAIIMIDPFPNFDEGDTVEEVHHPQTILETAPEVIMAIRRQAMIKESEISKGFIGDYTRHMVFPTRRKGDKRQKYTIACGALGGFGGFFSRKFRVHDFFLGRKNCQSFLRKHFSLAEDVVFKSNAAGGKMCAIPAFATWEKGAAHYQRFHYIKDDKVYFPIIPDLRISDAMSDDPAKNGTLSTPPYEAMHVSELKALRKPIRRRVKAVLYSIVKDALKPGKADISEEDKRFNKSVKQIVNKYLGSPGITRIVLTIALIIFALLLIPLLPFLFILFLIIRFWLVNTITRNIFSSIVSDFKRRELIK